MIHDTTTLDGGPVRVRLRVGGAARARGAEGRIGGTGDSVNASMQNIILFLYTSYSRTKCGASLEAEVRRWSHGGPTCPLRREKARELLNHRLGLQQLRAVAAAGDHRHALAVRQVALELARI